MGLAKFVIGKTYTTCGCLAISGPDSSIFRMYIDFYWVILKVGPIPKKGLDFGW